MISNIKFNFEGILKQGFEEIDVPNILKAFAFYYFSYLFEPEVKANDDLLQTIYETRINESKVLSSDQIEDWEREIKIQCANIQGLHYQKTKNDLLTKGQKHSWNYLVLLLQIVLLNLMLQIQLVL
jgi:hypothetical protein